MPPVLKLLLIVLYFFLYDYCIPFIAPVLGCNLVVFITGEYNYGNEVEAIFILSALLLMTVFHAIITQAFLSNIGNTARWFSMMILLSLNIYWSLYWIYDLISTTKTWTVGVGQHLGNTLLGVYSAGLVFSLLKLSTYVLLFVGMWNP